jgi:hypothetical protein
MTGYLRSIVAASALAFVVVSCGGDSTRHPSWLLSHHLGAPQGITTVGIPGSGVRDVVVRPTAGHLEVVTWGSSGCPRLPDRLVTPTADALSISMSYGAPPAGSSCPADLAPTTSVIQIPGTVDLTQTITVTLDDGVYGLSVALPAP